MCWVQTKSIQIYLWDNILGGIGSFQTDTDVTKLEKKSKYLLQMEQLLPNCIYRNLKPYIIKNFCIISFIIQFHSIYTVNQENFVHHLPKFWRLHIFITAWPNPQKLFDGITVVMLTIVVQKCEELRVYNAKNAQKIHYFNRFYKHHYMVDYSGTYSQTQTCILHVLCTWNAFQIYL